MSPDPIRRLRMASRAPRLALERTEASRSIARALLTTAVGLHSAGERRWIARIEQRRGELAADETSRAPSFGRHVEQLPPWAAEVDRPHPVAPTAASMSIPPLECRLLAGLIRELRPRSCLELGTGFGISTAYQAAALELNGAGKLVTLDAAAEWGRLAADGFAALGLNGSVEMRLGPIDDLLAETAPAIAPIEYALLDADHSEEATVRHFEALLPHLAQSATVVLDDINWTEEMGRAWRAVRRHERVVGGAGTGRLGLTVVSGP